MDIGLITEYNAEVGEGLLVTIGIKGVDIGETDYEVKICKFDIDDCTTVIHNGKLVAVDSIIKLSTNKNTQSHIKWKNYSYSANDIYDLGLDIKIQNFDKEFLLGSEYFGQNLLDNIPICNPYLFDFFISNELFIGGLNLAIRERFDEYTRKIERIDFLLNTLNETVLTEVLSCYDVSIRQYARSRPGKDDIASVSIACERNFRDGDIYLDEYLPNYEILIKRMTGYMPAERLLNDLWEYIGGNTKRRQIETECEELKRRNLKRLKEIYSFKAHRRRLKRELTSTQRNMKLIIQNYYKKIDFF